MEDTVKLEEERKEDKLYYQGGFWIVGLSIKDILKGKFDIVGKKTVCDYNGKNIDLKQSINSLTHKRLWRDEFAKNFSEELDYNYFPRGRVCIYNGQVFIHIHHLFNNPNIIDAICKYYEIELPYEVELNDETQGSHYDFQLK